MLQTNTFQHGFVVIHNTSKLRGNLFLDFLAWNPQEALEITMSTATSLLPCVHVVPARDIFVCTGVSLGHYDGCGLAVMVGRLLMPIFGVTFHFYCIDFISSFYKHAL